MQNLVKSWLDPSSLPFDHGYPLTPLFRVDMERIRLYVDEREQEQVRSYMHQVIQAGVDAVNDLPEDAFELDDSDDASSSEEEEWTSEDGALDGSRIEVNIDTIWQGSAVEGAGSKLKDSGWFKLRSIVSPLQQNSSPSSYGQPSTPSTSLISSFPDTPSHRLVVDPSFVDFTSIREFLSPSSFAFKTPTRLVHHHCFGCFNSLYTPPN